MGTLQVYQCVAGSVDSRPVQLGSLSVARSISLSDDEFLDQTHKVAAETAVKVWDKSEMETLADFDFFYIESDRDVLLQFTTDAGGDDEYFVIEVAGSGTANVMGPATILGSDLAHQFDGTVDAFDGTEDTIDEAWVYNESSTYTARVRVVIAT